MARKTETERAAMYANHCLKQYGLTMDALEAMKAAQNNCCAACADPCDRLQVDHCHETGIVRGLLCSRCNNALGQVKDDPDRLKKLLDYLQADDIDFNGHHRCNWQTVYAWIDEPRSFEVERCKNCGDARIVPTPTPR